jgi:hypothetical protein
VDTQRGRGGQPAYYTENDLFSVRKLNDAVFKGYSPIHELNSGSKLRCAARSLCNDEKQLSVFRLASIRSWKFPLTATLHLSKYITQHARPLNRWVSSQSGQPASLSGRLWLGPFHLFSLQRRAPGEGPPSRCALLSTPTHALRTLLITTGPPTIPIWGNEHQIPKADGHFV